MRARVAAAVGLIGIGLTGCAGDASTGTAPMAVVRAAQSSVAPSSRARANAPAHGVRAVRRRSGVPASAAASPATEPSPARSRAAAPARALAPSNAPRLAAPACEQYAAGRAGRLPRAVRARGSARALALLTESVAAALLGMPIVAPAASHPARERLDDARARMERALAAGDDARATAIALATAPRIAAYAHALGIADCG